MDDTAVPPELEPLIRLLEQHSELTSNMLEAMSLQRRRVDALEETLDDALAELMKLRTAAGFLLNMKAATLTMVCVKCGARYAKEPGAELCGPCWVAAGRPGTTGLYLVTTTATGRETDGDTA